MSSLHPTPSTLPPNRPKLLIIDDEEAIRTQMKWGFASDYEVFLAGDRKGALEIIEREMPAVVTLDLGLPPDPRDSSEGLRTLEDIFSRDTAMKVIVITGNMDRKNALHAIERGAFDFYYKPINIDELKVIVKRASYIYELERENKELQKRLSQEGFKEIVGNSRSMMEVFTTIRKVASTDASVIITGESGTGKELAARAIHAESPRRENSFVAINCSAIPENLLESELFGHEKGAFTGAHVQRKGKIEFADGGTLFLDEIGELSLSLQVKLLRFLQERVIERVGGREGIRVDARVIAATNTDLKQAIEGGKFREDLFYRLSVVRITLPPLRERENDFMLLGKIFLSRFSQEFNKRLKGFSQEAIQAMQSFSWPGNVRELENRIKRAVIMVEGPWVTAEDLELPVSKETAPQMTLKEAREECERSLISQALIKNAGNMTQTAVDLGISRPSLYVLMNKYKIKL
jgi:two-component system NtrC family response regulator